MNNVDSNIFLSWSGSASHAFAQLFKVFISKLLDDANPWISSEDIGIGAFDKAIHTQLRKCPICIPFITRLNVESPWIAYEAGAIGKGNRDAVCPFLCDFERHEMAVTGPLSRFQSCVFRTRSDVLKLVKNINRILGNHTPSAQLEKDFRQRWGKFQTQGETILKQHRVPMKHLDRNAAMSWAELHRLAEELYPAIHQFGPDLLFGVGVGGTILACQLAGFLGRGIPFIGLDREIKYDGDRQASLIGQSMLSSDEFKALVCGKKVVQVHGEFISGGTTKVVTQMLNAANPSKLITVCYDCRPDSSPKPDFYAVMSRHILKKPWKNRGHDPDPRPTNKRQPRRTSAGSIGGKLGGRSGK